jgi:hypothetical protein
MAETTKRTFAGSLSGNQESSGRSATCSWSIPKGSTYAEAVAEVRQWCATKQGQPATEPALESLDEAKARWESLLGVAVTPDEHGHLVLRSLTGFPLAQLS